MKKEEQTLGGIPAVIWGETSSRVIIAVHGSQSNKEDVIIEQLAQVAQEKNIQVLSFDLPRHGARKEEATLCIAPICVQELRAVLEYAQARWQEISVMGCSIGAYFALMAYKNAPIHKVVFLSPVLDLRRVIENMMMWAQITREQLKEAGEIPTEFGETLYWTVYTYVCENPIEQWGIPTAILYGEADNMTSREILDAFSTRFGAEVTILSDGEHYFHTPEQLAAYARWLKSVL